MASIRPLAHFSTFRFDRPRRLAWYVCAEFLKGWSLALVVITAVMFLAMGGREFVSSQQNGLLQIVKAMPLFLPITLPYTIPFSLLVGTTLTFGRLSADNEVAAIRASGVNLLTIIAPILGLSLVLSGVIFFLNNTVVPQSTQYQRALFHDLASSGAVTRMLNVHGKSIELPQRGETKRIVYIRDLDRVGRAVGVIYHETVRGQVKKVVFAEWAEITIDPESGGLTLIVNGAVAWEYDPEEPHRLPTNAVWANGVIELPPLTEGEEDEKKKNAELSIRELRERRGEREANLATGMAAAKLLPEPYRAEQIKTLGRVQRQIWRINTEIEVRWVLAFSCFTFALVAVPLGILVKKSNKMAAFLISVLLVIVIYYPLVVGGKAIAEKGMLPAGLCMWAANGVLFAIGAVLMHRVIRR